MCDLQIWGGFSYTVNGATVEHRARWQCRLWLVWCAPSLGGAASVGTWARGTASARAPGRTSRRLQTGQRGRRCRKRHAGDPSRCPAQRRRRADRGSRARTTRCPTSSHCSATAVCAALRRCTAQHRCSPSACMQRHITVQREDSCCMCGLMLLPWVQTPLCSAERGGG